MAGQDDDDTRETERALRDQVRELQEQARVLKEEAREAERRRDRSDREHEREERHREREEHHHHEEHRRREERGPRRGPRGFGFGFPGPPGPPPGMPGMPGMPMPPIPGAGGTFSPYDFFGAMFGDQQRPRRGRGGRGRASRGDVRITILLLLSEGPANGYQLMQAIEQRTNGAWKPSSGSIYPALQQLEDEGVVEAGGESRKTFSLTEQGSAYVSEHRSEWTPPWENLEEDEGPSEEAVKIRDLVAQLAMAYMQVIQVGTEAQRSEAARVLTAARQSLYRILAGDSEED